MNLRIRKKRFRGVSDSQDLSSEHVENVIEGEDFRTFDNIPGAEAIEKKHCLILFRMETDQNEDTLKQQIDENFIIINECIDELLKDAQARGYSELRTKKVIEAFKVLFEDDEEESVFFPESRFYCGSQATSPIEKLNLLTKKKLWTIVFLQSKKISSHGTKSTFLMPLTAKYLATMKPQYAIHILYQLQKLQNYGKDSVGVEPAKLLE